MRVVLGLLVLLPLVAVAVSGLGRHRLSAAVTLAMGCVSLALAIVLLPPLTHGVVTWGFLRVDAVSEVFLLTTALLYAATSAYSVGYLAEESQEARGAGGESRTEFERYSRRFYVGFNLFAWSMLCAPTVDGLALLWVAIEITTVVSALLVAIDDTDGATEAAWKYVLLASSGLGIALLATIVMYDAGASALGDSYDLAFQPLLGHASALPQTPVRLAFALAVVGFGTKVGLFPVHTWLPDAHAEAPTPVSALLSGSLLAVSFYAILRYYQVAAATLGPTYPQRLLAVFGVLSLLIAALYVLDQQGLKRLLAYSSVEHMGILAIGVSFGAPTALAGVMLHVLAHGAAKGTAFMGAGALVRAFGTKSLTRMRAGLDRLPWVGTLFLMSILALSALPPFGLFRSEFQIVEGGLAAGRSTWAAVLVVLVTLAFLGISTAATRVLYQPQPTEPSAHAGADRAARPVLREVDDSLARESGQLAVIVVSEPAGPSVRPAAGGWWMVAPMVFCVAVLLVLGVWPPPDLARLFSAAAATLSGGAP